MYLFDAHLYATKYIFPENGDHDTVVCFIASFPGWRANNCFKLRKYDPLDETHLDAVRGLILLRGFHPAHQQVELVGAMRLQQGLTDLLIAYAKDLIQSWRI